MGSSQSLSAEELLSSAKEYNIMLLTAIKFHLVEEAEYGAALKILKITYLTKDYYSKTSKDKEYLYKNLPERRKRWIDELVNEEYAQLSETNEILTLMYKILKNQFRKLDPVRIYNDIYSKSDKLVYGLEFIENKYHESNRPGIEFEEIVESVDRKRPIHSQHEYMINEICKKTTHLFSNKQKRIDYLELMKIKD